MSEASKYLKQSFSDGPVQKRRPHTAEKFTFWGNFSNKDWKQERRDQDGTVHTKSSVCARAPPLQFMLRTETVY